MGLVPGTSPHGSGEERVPASAELSNIKKYRKGRQGLGPMLSRGGTPPLPVSCVVHLFQFNCFEASKDCSVGSFPSARGASPVTVCIDIDKYVYLSDKCKIFLHFWQFFNAQSFKWAFGILFSRLVRLQSLNEQVALVPWADMVNHSSQVKACLDYEAASKTIILTTDKAYQPSEQVFISYGDKSKGEILLSYGFVSANADGMDSLDISLSLSRDDEMFAAKQAALEEHGLSSTCKYPITIGGIPSQLFAFSYLIACPSSLESRFSQMAAAAASKGVTRLDGFRPFTFDVPLDVDIQAYETILKTVEASLGKISRFLGENEKMNDAGMQKGNDGKLASLGLSGKLKMAYTLCVSEQRILQRAQYILRSKLRELRARKASSGEAGSGFLYGLGKLFK